LRRLLLVSFVGATMVLALATPAFAFHFEGHIGGGTPADQQCDAESCQGGFGGIFPYGCNPETGECSTTSEGGGHRTTFDPETGDALTTSGGEATSPVRNPGEGEEDTIEPGGRGGHCSRESVADNFECVGKGYTGGPA
jgi:hypothetical protein